MSEGRKLFRSRIGAKWVSRQAALVIAIAPRLDSEVLSLPHKRPGTVSTSPFQLREVRRFFRSSQVGTQLSRTAKHEAASGSMQGRIAMEVDDAIANGNKCVLRWSQHTSNRLMTPIISPTLVFPRKAVYKSTRYRRMIAFADMTAGRILKLIISNL